MKQVSHGNRYCRIVMSDSGFSDEFLALEDWFKSDDTWVFRGQASIRWSLTNTLERKYKEQVCREFNTTNAKMTPKEGLADWLSNSDDYVMNQLESIEKQLIKRFKESIGEDCEEDPSLVKYMSLMQHYGMPTRLLDFTRSPNIALFFALNNQGEADKGTNRVVLAINTHTIEEWVKPYKKQLLESDGCADSDVELKLADKLVLNAKSEMALKHRWYPIRMEGNNLRMIAQKGLFMMPLRVGTMDHDLAETMGYEYNPHEATCMSFEEFAALSADEKSRIAVVSIEFPISVDNNARSILEAKRITWERLFPDKLLIDYLKDDIV